MYIWYVAGQRYTRSCDKSHNFKYSYFNIQNSCFCRQNDSRVCHNTDTYLNYSYVSYYVFFAIHLVARIQDPNFKLDILRKISLGKLDIASFISTLKLGISNQTVSPVLVLVWIYKSKLCYLLLIFFLFLSFLFPLWHYSDMSLSYQVKSSQVNFISDIKIYNTVKYTIFKNRNKHRNKKTATVFQNQVGKKNRGEGEFFKFLFGGKLLEMKLQKESSERKFRMNLKVL